MPLPNVIPSSPIVNIDVSQGNKVVLLPAASTVAGNIYTIRDWKAACGPSSIYVSSIGLDSIDGIRQIAMTSTLEIMKVMSLGNTSWSLLNRNKTITSNLKITALLPVTIVFGSSSFGSVGTITAAPTWNWVSTGGKITYYTITLYGDTNNPPTTSIGGLTPPTALDTSYTFPGATVVGYYYKLVVTAFNNLTSSSFEYTQYNNILPVLSYSSFSWGGSQGSTSAQPIWNWSVTLGSVASYTLTLLGDTNNPPTTAISVSQPSAAATSYMFPGATVLGYYYKFSLTATNAVGTSSAITDQEYNNVTPVLSYSSFSWGGSQGSTSAQPIWNWSVTSGTIGSYTLTLLGDTSNPPTTAISVSQPSASATSYTFPGATVLGYYYKFSLTATNAVGTSSAITDQEYNNVTPVLSYSSFSWVGTQGSTSAQPRWNWSVTSGTIASYTVTLLGDTSNPPTTAISVSQPSAGATSYTYPGATVLGYYYKFSLTATNPAGTSSAITDQEYNNVTPVLSYSSFSWVGTQGSTSAQPRWNWSVTLGSIGSYTLTLLGDTSNPPTTAISVSQPSAGATSYTYPGATVAGYYYKFSLTATNPVGTSSAITDQEYNNATPVLSYSSFSWVGTQGSTSAQPRWTWSVTAGTIGSYTVTLLGDTSNPPTTAISVSQPASSATSYTFPGATVAGYYYKFSLTATNALGTSSAITDQEYNNVAPVLSYSSFSWVGTQGSTSAQPRWNWSVTSGSIASYTLTLLGDTSNPPTTAISVSQPSAAATSYTFPGATVLGYYYKFSLTATNAAGTSSAITDQEYNNVTPVLSYSSFSWVGTQGSTSAQPSWNWSVTSGTIASYTLTLLGDTSNPPTTAISVSQPSASATSYTFPGATVAGYYYKFSLTATNAVGTSSAITDQEYNNVTPVLSYSSFSWVGTQGSTSAQPRWNWSVTLGSIGSYTLTLLGDTSNPPTTAISVSQPAAGATSYTYPGATVLGYYYKFSLTATNPAGTSSAITDQEYNNVTPVLSYSSFSWVGTQGSTSAQPRWNWSVTAGTIGSYTLTLLGDTSNPPTTAISVSQPAAGATSYTFPGATVTGYYYKFSLTATNPVGTSSAITNQVYNNVAPVISYSSFTFVSVGTTNAQPTWNWSSTGGSVASYTLALYADTNPTPTTLISSTPPSASATTYTYSSATVLNYYYKLDLTATNTLGSSSFTDTQLNLEAPTITFTSFSWQGTQGSTNAQPTWNWSKSGGAVSSYSLKIFADTNSSPTTLISSTPPSASATSYTYSGATVSNYYYKLVLIAINTTANSSPLTNTQFNEITTLPPNLSGSMSFTGTQGSTNAEPTLTWSNTGDAVASYSLVLNYGATSGLGSSLSLKPPATSDTSYIYKYVYFVNGDPMPINGASITITNVSGSTIIRFRLTDSYGVISDTSGLSVAMGQTYTYTLTHDLTPNGYGFSIFAYFGGGPPSEIYQVTSNNGLISITTYYATFLDVGLTVATVANYYYQLVLTGTNAGGSNTLTPAAIQNAEASVHIFTTTISSSPVNFGIYPDTSTQKTLSGMILIEGQEGAVVSYFGNVTVTNSSATVNVSITCEVPFSSEGLVYPMGNGGGDGNGFNGGDNSNYSFNIPAGSGSFAIYITLSGGSQPGEYNFDLTLTIS